jgi:hypothetical protein
LLVEMVMRKLRYKGSTEKRRDAQKSEYPSESIREKHNTCKKWASAYLASLWFLSSLRNLRQNPHVMLALDGTGNLGYDVVVVEGTAELLNETSLNILRAYPGGTEKFAAWLHIAHEAGFINKDRDMQAMLADYSQPIRVTPTRFLVGVEMQSIST